MLVLCFLAIVDGGNIGAPKGVEPLAIGLIAMALGVSMGLNCGYPLNPARDLGPRLFTAVAGWGMEVFRYHAPPVSSIVNAQYRCVLKGNRSVTHLEEYTKVLLHTRVVVEKCSK